MSRSSIRLSRIERWVLANQYRILEALYPDDAEHYKQAREVLEEGYEAHYGDIYTSLVRGENTLSGALCDEVQQILQMYWVLQRTYESLPDIEKDGIDATKLTFPGFDGNNETKLMAYARWYCIDCGNFAGLRYDDRFNSHRVKLGDYQQMLARWNALSDEGVVTREQIIEVISPF